MSLDQLSRTDRLRLMRFVCSFVWADLQVRDRERAFVRKLADRLGLQSEAGEIDK